MFVGGPMSVTTQRSVSATLFLPDQTAARKSPHLWEFSSFFLSLLFLLSLRLLLPALTCLRGLVASTLARVQPDARSLSRLCVAAPLLSREDVDSQSQFQARSLVFPESFGWI